MDKKQEFKNSIAQSIDTDGDVIRQTDSVYYNCAANEYRYKVFTVCQIRAVYDAYTHEFVL